MYINNEDTELIEFLGKIVRIDNEGHKVPIFGRLKTIGPQFLVIERKQGYTTLIKRKSILLIEAVRDQGTEAV